MHALADNGRHVLAEDGARLLFLERGILPSWLVFVPGLLAVVAVGNGLVQVVLGHLAAAGALVLLGAGSALALQAVRGSRRRAMARPLDPAAALLVIDLGARLLLDGADQILAPLDAVRVERSMQVTSSARALRVSWPGGSMVVYRGDPLQRGGSIDAAARALHARGVPVAA